VGSTLVLRDPPADPVSGRARRAGRWWRSHGRGAARAGSRSGTRATCSRRGNGP